MRNCGVYRIKSKASGRYYIGSSKNVYSRIGYHFSRLRNNSHYNPILQNTYNKYGEDDFDISFKFVDSEEEARELEQYYIDKLYKKSKCMNLSKSSICGYVDSKHPDWTSIKKRRLQSQLDYIDSLSDEEYTNRFRSLVGPRNGMYNKRHSEKTKKAIVESLSEHYESLSVSQRKAIYGQPGKLNGMFGKTHSKETRKKLSEFHKGNSYALGNVWSEQSKKAMSDGAKRRAKHPDYVNPFAGKTHTAETLAVLSNIAKARVAAGHLPSNTRRVKIGKKTYKSLSQAARELGVVAATVLNRIRSENYPEYCYLD